MTALRKNLANETDHRPWGLFEVLLDEKYTKVKKILVNPGKPINLILREETWVIVKGTLTIIINDIEHICIYGELIHIPSSKHRAINKTDKIVEFIEVQTGNYFGEDDICVYSDDFNRFNYYNKIFGLLFL